MGVPHVPIIIFISYVLHWTLRKIEIPFYPIIPSSFELFRELTLRQLIELSMFIVQLFKIIVMVRFFSSDIQNEGFTEFLNA